MGRRGTYPKPDFLKVLDGNPGKRAITKSDEKALVQHLAAPDWFDGELLEIWADVTRVLMHVRALTEGDKFPLQRYCELLLQYRQASRFMRDTSNGQIVYTVKGAAALDSDGKEKPREIKSIRMLPHLKAMIEISNHLLKIENYFGLTPSARAMFGKGAGGRGDGDDGRDPWDE